MARFVLTPGAGADQVYLPYLATLISLSGRWWAFNDDSGFYIPSTFTNNDDRIDVTVTNFTPVRGSGGLEDILTGRITDMTLFEPGDPGRFVITGLSISAPDFYDARAAGNGALLAQMVFGANDVFIGTNVRDTIWGQGGRDRINGYAGNDSLRGGQGADTLSGGRGADELIGGQGADRFVFDAPAVAGQADRIRDFDWDEDVIAFDNDVFAGFGTSTGGLKPGTLRFGVEAGDQTDRLVYHTATGRLWYDPDGAGDRPQVLVANLGAGTQFGASDAVIF